MDIYLCNEYFQAEFFFEKFESCIWTNRWQSIGDCTLVVPTQDLNFENYETLIEKKLYYREADEYMIIDAYELSYTQDKGEMLTIYAKDLLSLLARRIVWGQQVLSTQTLKSAVNKLMNKNIIDTGSVNRDMSSMMIGSYTTDISIESTQFTGDNLFDAIISLCGTEYAPNVRIDKNSGMYVFTLKESNYSNCIFSRDLDNLISTKILFSVRDFKNATLVAGEGEGSARKVVSVTRTIKDNYRPRDESRYLPSDETRRELFTDARDISSTTEDGTLTTAEYNTQLRQRGKASLLENNIARAIEAEIDTSMYKYNKDYQLGDYITIIDTHNNRYQAKVTEYIRAEDINGFQEYPNYQVLMEEEE